MLKRYLVLSVATAAFSLPSLVYAAQQNILSVHILNQQTGKPAADVTVTLEKKADNGWLQLNTAKTDKDGRIKALWPEQTATTVRRSAEASVSMVEASAEKPTFDSSCTVIRFWKSASPRLEQVAV